MIHIEWYSEGEAPKCKPDPAYPNGKALESPGPGRRCVAPLPYPSPCIGAYRLVCDKCGMQVAVTAAGRPDDPVSVEIVCAKAR